MTSHDVVAYIRKITGIKKVGHSGTLDPSAVGVLPIFIGKATKVIDFIKDETKSYRAELKLGVITDTGDKDGNVISAIDWKKELDKNGFDIKINEIMKSFIGKSGQIPPMYSAVKINGQKLYTLARQGKEVIRNPREITISKINIISSSFDEGLVLFDIDCSKGTYIRVICEDIGRKLGCGACMSYLIRTRSSYFEIESAHTLEDIENLLLKNNLSKVLISIEDVLNNTYKKYVITDNDEIKKIMNGCSIVINNKSIINNCDQLITVYIKEKFVGIADILSNGSKSKYIKINKFFV